MNTKFIKSYYIYIILFISMLISLNNVYAGSWNNSGTTDIGCQTVAIPEGSTDITFTMSMTDGDWDLYVLHAGCPDSGTYDCRPYSGAGTTEVCTGYAANAGTGTDNWYVWVDAYSQAGTWTLDVIWTDPPTPDYVSEWISMDIGSTDWCPGETRDIKVTVKNIGALTWTDSGPDINIGVKWDADADYFVRTDAGSLVSGNQQEYTLSVTAPATTGANHLTFDIVNEGACWFGGNAGTCGPGNVTYFSAALTINSESTAPTSITGTTAICSGSSTTLTAIGGTTGAGADCYWFPNSCESIYAQEWNIQPYSLSNTTQNSVSGGILNVTSTSEDPMIRMESIGSFDPAIYKYIQIKYKVTAGTAGNAQIFYTNTRSTVAAGDQYVQSALTSDNAWHILTIDMSGATYWNHSNVRGWRFDWCTASGVTMDIDYISLSSGIAQNHGSSISVSPTSATTYYVLRSGTCNTTSCANNTVTVDQLSVGGTITGGTSPICTGTSTGTMTLSGHTGSITKWEKQVDGGGWADISNTTTTYSEVPASGTWDYRAVITNGVCPIANSATRSIVVNQSSVAATSISITNNNTCQGTTKTLSIVGGTLGDGASWEWYTSSCGGTSVHAGSTYDVDPASDTQYWLRAEGTCNTTSCVDATVQVYTSVPTTPTATAASNISDAQFTANWNAVVSATVYYLDVSENATFSSFITGYNNLNVGSVLSYNVTGLSENTNYYYRLRAYSTCGTSSNSNTIIAITSTPAMGLFITGNFSNSGVFEQGSDDYINMIGSSKELKGSAGSFVNVNLIINGGNINFNPAVEMLDAITNTYINDASVFTILTDKLYKNKTFVNQPGGTFNLNASSDVENSADWTNNSVVNANATSIVTFNGTSAQEITSGGSAFGEIAFDQSISSTIELLDDMEINTSAIFTSGVVNANATDKEIIFNNNTSSTITGGIEGIPLHTYSSFVNGPVKKIGTNDFTFPTGKIDGGNQEYRPIGIASLSASETFVAEYYYADPSANIGAAIETPALDHISTGEYWMLDRAGTTNANVILSWNDSWSDAVIDVSELLVARWDGAKWSNEMQTAYTGANAAGTITSQLVVDFSPFAISYKNSTLPVELVGFNVELVESIVDITWATLAEINNDYFVVEKSIDGIEFEQVDIVDGHGNSNQIMNYYSVDENPYKGISYYRLKQVDFDGQFTYSNIKIINNLVNEDFSDIQIYPNPTQDKFTVIINSNYLQNVEIKLFDMLGREIISENIYIYDSKINQAFNRNSIIDGVYSIVIIDLATDNIISKEKIIFITR